MLASSGMNKRTKRAAWVAWEKGNDAHVGCEGGKLFCSAVLFC